MNFKKDDIVICTSNYIYQGANFSPELVIGNVYKIIETIKYNENYVEVYIEYIPNVCEWFEENCFTHIKEYRTGVIDNILDLE